MRFSRYTRSFFRNWCFLIILCFFLVKVKYFRKNQQEVCEKAEKSTDKVYVSQSNWPLRRYVIRFLRYFTRKTGKTLMIIDAELLLCILHKNRCMVLRDKTDFKLATFAKHSCLEGNHLPADFLWEHAKRNKWSVHFWPRSPDPEHAIKVNFHVIFVEDRADYWYFPTGQPFALIKCNLSKLQISGRNISALVPSDIDKFLKDLQSSTFLECKKSMYSRFWPSFPNIKDSAIIDLAHFRDVLHSFGMRAMLIGGTLLGWYRDCGVIPHTDDIDVMSRDAEFNTSVIDALKKDKRFIFFWILGLRNDSFEMSYFTSKDGIKIDFFIIYEQTNQTYIGGMVPETRNKLRWVYPKLEKTCSADLRGYLFFVPCSTVKFLEANYGPNWHIPQSTFNWINSPSNVKNSGLWSEADWPRVFQKSNVSVNILNPAQSYRLEFVFVILGCVLVYYFYCYLSVRKCQYQ